ncbi:MAG: hypothetical protein ABMA01_21625 [Chthoniobacteraceae bacterium]
MKLPANAVIATGKLTDYLLRWHEENDKSAFLALSGYGPGDSERLERDIREQLLPLEAEWIEVSRLRPAAGTKRTRP